jgi:CheY-like chemotaxis protein
MQRSQLVGDDARTTRHAAMSFRESVVADHALREPWKGKDVRSSRILHIDDDPDIRDIVEMSLRLDPSFTTASCADGASALAVASQWMPDMILCDVMMPKMDGPATLARLRESTDTARIPVVFMTARAQPRDVLQLKLLGAVAVITKPFDPMRLAETVRLLLGEAQLAEQVHDFFVRMQVDRVALGLFRGRFDGTSDQTSMLDDLQVQAHALADAASAFDLPTVSGIAASLEQAIIAQRAGQGTPGGVAGRLDALLECIPCE